MTTTPPGWKSSPNAPEFLPEEIERLQAGAMVLCDECLWPRPVDAACANCATYNVDQDRDDDAVPLAPPEAPRK